MSDKPLMIIDNPPFMVVAGSGDEYGAVDGSLLLHLMDMAGNAYVSEGEEVDVAELVKRVNLLSDAVRNLAGQVFQIHEGIESGRIAVVPQG